MPGSSGSARVAFAAGRSAFAGPVFVAALAELAATGDTFAGAGFGDAGFAGVGSAPSSKVKLNHTEQKNIKRKAGINGDVAKVNAYLAEAAVYARRLPCCNKVTNAQPILFAAESQAHSAFPQFLQLRDERGGTLGKVTVIPPKLLSVGAEDHDSGKPHNLVLLRKFAVLLS